jgi:hypothetical protein
MMPGDIRDGFDLRVNHVGFVSCSSYKQESQ